MCLSFALLQENLSLMKRPLGLNASVPTIFLYIFFAAFAVALGLVMLLS